MRVTGTQRQRQLVRDDPDDVVGEDREVGALLVEPVARRLPCKRGVRNQRLDRGDDRRARTNGNARKRRIGRQRTRQEAAGKGIQIVVAGESGKRRVRADQRTEEGIGVAAGRQIVRDGQFLARCVAADQPVEMAIERRALQAKFLRHGAELVIGRSVVRAVKHVQRLEIGVLPARIFVVAVGSDRGQFGPAEILDDFGRNAAVVDVRAEAAARGDRYAARERIVLDLRAEAVEQRLERRRLATTRSGILRRGQERGGAAFLVALRIIADQPDREIGAGLIEQLPAHQEAVAIVDVAARHHVAQEAVALEINAIDPRRQDAAQGTGDPQLDAAGVVIADVDLAVELRGELGLGGDDRDQARRRIAPEQGALRSAQDFDPVDLAQFGEADADAAAIDAIDEHGDRAFQPGIVAHGADAANARAARARFGRGRRHQQRRADLGQLANVVDARIFQRVGGHRADRQRNIAQRLVAAGRGDDDVTIVDGGRRLRGIGNRSGLGRRTIGRRRSALVGVGLRRGLCHRRCRNGEQACRQQPDGFAHRKHPS